MTFSTTLVFMFSLHGKRPCFTPIQSTWVELFLCKLMFIALTFWWETETSFQTSKNKHFQDLFFSKFSHKSYFCLLLLFSRDITLCISFLFNRICSRHPDAALLAANTILQDCRDPNPAVKCLAVSTLCSLPPILQEHASPVLRAALKDGNPRVRQTAVIGCGKVFKHTQSLLFEQGFVDRYVGKLHGILT